MARISSDVPEWPTFFFKKKQNKKNTFSYVNKQRHGNMAAVRGSASLEWKSDMPKMTGHYSENVNNSQCSVVAMCISLNGRASIG